MIASERGDGHKAISARMLFTPWRSARPQITLGKKPCTVVAQFPKRVWKGKGRNSLFSPRAEWGHSLSILESLQKAKPLADLTTSATKRPTASQPLGNQQENVLQPSRQSWTRPGVTLVGWKSWRNFTQKLKWKNPFLYSPTLHSTLIGTLKSFIEPWQLNESFLVVALKEGTDFPTAV